MFVVWLLGLCLVFLFDWLMCCFAWVDLGLLAFVWVGFIVGLILRTLLLGVGGLVGFWGLWVYLYFVVCGLVVLVFDRRWCASLSLVD